MGYVDSYNLSTKSHAKLGILCLVGGVLGMHRFYAEKLVSASIMGVLFLSSFFALMIHPIAWGVLLGMDILAAGVDFFQIMFNDFEDSLGKKISSDNAVKENDPLFGMLFFATLGIYLLIVGAVIINYVPAIACLLICGIFAIKEINFIKKM